MPATFDRIWLGADQTVIGNVERPCVWTIDDPPWVFRSWLTTQGTDNRVVDIKYYSESLIVACGTNGGGHGEVWVSTDLGVTWTTYTLDIYPGETNCQPSRFYRVDAENFILMVAANGGANAGMWLVHWDGGSTWTYIKKISTSAAWGIWQNGLDGIGGGLANDYIMCMNGAWNEYSYWDGGSLINAADWHDGTQALGGLSSGRVHAVSATEIYCCGHVFWPSQSGVWRWNGGAWSYYGVNWGVGGFSDNNGGGVYKDPETGLVWTAGRREVSGTEYVAVGYSDGVSWTWPYTLGTFAAYGDVVDFVKFEDEIAWCGFISTGTGYVVRSRDGGASWTVYHGATDPSPTDWKRCGALDISAPSAGGHSTPKPLVPGGDNIPLISVAERDCWRRRGQS